MRKDTQKIAFCILIPMLFFTFIVTISSNCSKKIPFDDPAKNVIYNYFNYRNDKNIESLQKLLINEDDLNKIQEDSNYLKNIKLLEVKEEKNDSIKNAYMKNNDSINGKNIKIYSVKYEVKYDSQSKYSNKSGTFNSWYFLMNTSGDEWQIDVGAI